MTKRNWTDFKNLVTQQGLFIRMDERDACYYLFAFDGPITYRCDITKSEPPSEDQTDFETNFKSNTNKKVQQSDTDNAQIVRVKAAKAGWSYCACAFEFSTSVVGSVVALNHDGTSKNYINIKLFDDDGVLITDPLLQNTAVRTEVEYEPPYDYEVIGGEMRTSSDMVDDVRMFIVAAPDVPYAYGGSRVMCENLNLKYLYPGNMFQVDGRVSKFLSYNATYHTNKLRFIMWHPAGVTEKLMITIEHYRQ